jgi:hypothetical protein
MLTGLRATRGDEERPSCVDKGSWLYYCTGISSLFLRALSLFPLPHSSPPTTAFPSDTHRDGTAAMAQDATTPTLNEAQGKAQFEDCTPCRVVGRALPLPLWSVTRRSLTRCPQELQPLSVSEPSPMSLVTRNSRPARQRSEPARACLGCAADERR